MTNSIIRERKQMPSHNEWLKTRAEKDEEQRQREIELRLLYIQKMLSHIPPYCPECHTHLIIDDEQISCPACGLVTQDSTYYNGGQKFHLPHGLRLG